MLGHAGAESVMSVKCSFCGIDNDDPRCAVVIAGPDNAAICNECVMKCLTIMNDKLNDEHSAKLRKERYKESNE